MQFKYQALDSHGQEVSGVLSADNPRDAARQLQKQQLKVLSLDAAGQRASKPVSGKPKPRDVLMMLHELTTLLESGVSLIEAVEALASSTHHPLLTGAFAEISGKLRHGKAFSQAVKESDLGLPWFMPHLAEAGELTGKLGQALRHGVEQMEYERQVRDELRNALIYPVILVVSGVVAVLLIFILVVPRFATMLGDKADQLPLLAYTVLSSGMFLNQHWQWIAGAGVGLLGLAIMTAKNPVWRTKLYDSLSGLPVLGEWIIEAETGRWAAMLGTLLENRVPMLRALELAQAGMQLSSFNARLSQVGKAVRAGHSLAEALVENQAITSTGHNLIRAGERAGELPRMLRSLAKLYTESGRVRMKRFLLLLEPLAILTIGGVIGFIITGVILAITSVNQIGM